MKTNIRNFRTLGTALSLAFTFAFSTVGMANEGGDDKPKVEFKFIGKVQDLPVYQLDLLNAEDDEFTITIRDRSGSILYFDRLKGQNISRKFQFSPEGLEDDVLRIEVKSKSNSKADVYEINKVAHYIQENVVTKLK